MSPVLVIIVSVLLLWIILTIVELIQLHRFNLKFFKLGFNLYKREIDFDRCMWSNFDGIYNEKEGKYVFIPEQKAGYFVTNFELYRHYNLFFNGPVLPLTIFGCFYEEESRIKIQYKISYRHLALIVIWMVPWVILPFFIGNLLAFGIGSGGVLFSLFFLFLIYFYQKGKMLIISDEIEKLLRIKK